MTHDYVRHGTTTLFAALGIAGGQVLTQNGSRQRHQEFLGSLHRIKKNVPEDLEVHVVVDNYCTHKHAKVKGWIASHPRFHFHFTPTYASWLNQVKRWFGLITQAGDPARFLRQCEGARADDRSVRRGLQQGRHAVHVVRDR